MDSNHQNMPSVAPRCGGERGASLVEYAVMVALIAVVCAVAIGFLGGSTNSSFDDANSRIAEAKASQTN
ncbi:MAG TPA: hypothetical protein VIR58_04705 [Acidimicrobiales bacterium]